jgi:site-specific DNA recombinase
MRAIGYIRVSTEDQHLGMDAQRATLDAWCARHGAELAAVHVDHGISGAAPLDKRPGLLAAVEALDKGSVLLVAKRDRLARDVMLAAMVERLAERAGASVASADGVAAGNGPEAQLMRSIIDAFAQYERALIRARTKAALAVKRGRGEYTGGDAPYGYRLEGTPVPRVVKGKPRVSLEGGRYVPVPEEQATIALARELRQGRTLRAVAAELQARGIVSRTGRPFAAIQIARMIAA